ncbi:unnamed protein product [Sympodiomycopsis kandeliae]
MTRYDSPISGPFLELSTANLDLNELSVDELAALWNVFTKVGDSLHKGRRLENFVWRAWHREAHLLPPDSSWSDFADCTPLETPVLSRAGSISQSYHLRPAITQALASASAQWPVNQATAAENLPSDPESGADWSDDDEDDDGEESGDEEKPTSIAAPNTRPNVPVSQAHAATNRQNTSSNAVAGPSKPKAATSPLQRVSASSQHTRKSSSNTRAPPSPPLQSGRPSATAGTSSPSRPSRSITSPYNTSAALPNVHERKRNSSSSSAFGSRSRVRHLNPGQSSRRRPISFQAALESLTNGTETDDLATLAKEHQNRGLGSAYERRSFQGVSPMDIAAPAPGQDQRSTQQQDLDQTIAATASHSSAPASSTFEGPSATASNQQIVPDQGVIGESEQVRLSNENSKSRSDESRTAAAAQTGGQRPQPETQETSLPAASGSHATPPAKTHDPSHVDQSSNHPKTSTSSSTNANGRKGKAKFFLSTSASRSFGDDESASGTSVSPMPQHHATSSISNANNAPDQPKRPDASMPPPIAAVSSKGNKSKTEGSHAGGLTSTQRNRSAAALHKNAHGGNRSRIGLAHGHGHGHGHSHAHAHRQTHTHGHGHGSSSRLAGGTGLVMTKAVNPYQSAKAPPAASKAGARPKPKFTMGGDEDDEDAFTDDDSDPQEEENRQVQAHQAQQPEPKQPAKDAEPSTKGKGKTVVIETPKEEDVDEVDDDEERWSSDTSAEAEDERKRQEAEAMRRRQADEERRRDLFKKVPVRSASAADVRHFDPTGQGNTHRDVIAKSRHQSSHAVPNPTPQENPAPHPIRGLLSSLFHPEQEARSPPGTLQGRPHASAADLRVKQERAPTATGHHRSERKHHRPPSLISGTPGGHHSHHHSAGGSDGMGIHESSNHPEVGSGEGTSGGLRSSKSAVALPVLDTAGSLTSPGLLSGRSGEEAEMTQTERRQRPGSLEHASSSGSQHRSPMRRSQSSGNSQNRHHAENRQPEPVAAPTLAPHRAGLPTPAALQTPRTTRRNMLRDELSESLRQNLLWERHSRNRMLGIAANGPREANSSTRNATQGSTGGGAAAAAAQPPPRAQRRETVLGGNQLRPLTTKAPSGTTTSAHRRTSGGDDIASGSRAPESKPKQSRSTPSLPDLATTGQRRSTSGQRHVSGGYSGGHDASADTSDDDDKDEQRTGRSGKRENGGSSGSSSSDEDDSRALRSTTGGPHDTISGSSTNTGDSTSSRAASGHRRGASSTALSQLGHGHDPSRQQPPQKKKTMWPGGFPNYHQHGW